MTPVRYNAFNQIHKGLRALFYDTALTIQRTDFRLEDARETIETVRLVLRLIEEHGHHEDKFILPLIIERDAGMVKRFEDDHLLDHRIVEDLELRLELWISTQDASGRAAVGEQIFRMFNQFVAFNLYHMNREEEELLPVLWDCCTDDELRDVTARIVSSIDPETLMIESVWMLRGLNDHEIAAWFLGMNAGAPPEVFTAHMELARRELTEVRFARLENALKQSVGAAI